MFGIIWNAPRGGIWQHVLTRMIGEGHRFVVSLSGGENPVRPVVVGNFSYLAVQIEI